MDENTKRIGNIILRGRALRLLEDIGSDLNIADLKSVIDEYGFTYHEFTPTEKNKALLGAVHYEDRKIYVNKYMPSNERHFTLAHEIGHIVLHPNQNHVDFRRSNQKKDPKESEANVFAYELLMPLPKFTRAYKRFNGNVMLIAEEFFVSEKCVGRRIDFLKKQILDKDIYDFIGQYAR
jgi:Zn-dependent peptidase ImmA (M78 family)